MARFSISAFGIAYRPAVLSTDTTAGLRKTLTNTELSRTCLGALLAAVSSIQLAAAQAETRLPYRSTDSHLGVASCAASTCHGSTITRQSNVEQDEYLVWSDDEYPDKHAGAYDVLFNDLSRRIAANLGLEAAHEAQVCLDCHTDFVPPDRRGESFSLAEGVGCEACHGGAERYLERHDEPDTTHERNLELGLFPTDDPRERARLCLSCHFGNDDKYVTHRIMGAGHPRLSFELDTFTADQPAHFLVDDDYARRKRVWTGVQTWAIGQTIAARHFANAVLQGRDTGLFPELTLFDCHSCHHSMDDLRWRPRESIGLGPGALRFNDANLLMTYQLARVAAPDRADRLHAGIRALHQAARKDRKAVAQACRDLIEMLDGMQTVLADYAFSNADMYGLIDGLIEYALQGEYRDYAAAEQTAMAISSVLIALEQAGGFDRERGDILFAELDKVFDAVESDDEFRPAGFENALQMFRQVLKG